MAISMSGDALLSSLHDARGQALRRALVAPPTFEQALAEFRDVPALIGCADALQELLARVTVRLDDVRHRDCGSREARELLALREAIGRLILDRTTEFAADEIVVADGVLANLYGRFFDDPRVRPLATLLDPEVVPLLSVSAEPLRRHASCLARNGLATGVTWVRTSQMTVRSVWLWPCLAHEMGHELYAVVSPGNPDRSGYAAHLEAAVADCVGRGIREHGYGSVVALEGPQPGVEESAVFLAELWRRWCDEAHADAVALLQLGPAAAAAMQEALPGRRIGHTRDPHPPDAIRCRFATRLLARLGVARYNGALERRLPLDDLLVVDAIGARYRVPAALSDASITAAVEALLTFRNPALGGLALPEILSFGDADQECVEACVAALLDRIALPDAVTPRQLLAAARLAFERSPERADALHSHAVYLLADLRG